PDNLESCALWEACKKGHDGVLQLLVAGGGSLGSGPLVATRLCRAVGSGDLPLLARLLRARADPCAADYDRRTAAHIAAAEGNQAALQLLLSVPAAFGPDAALASLADSALLHR
ncbi:potassium channel AKT2, partial [Haematococcus lacustris]